jgi:hypothetical protein
VPGAGLEKKKERKDLDVNRRLGCKYFLLFLLFFVTAAPAQFSISKIRQITVVLPF